MALAILILWFDHFFNENYPEYLENTMISINNGITCGDKCHKVVESGDSMFIGEYKHKLDAKNRMALPVKFREQIGDTFIMTKGLDGCLCGYTMEKWNAILAKLVTLPSTNKQARTYVRALTSKASECSFDSQGRIQIPTYLLKEANLTKEVMVVGVADRIELWDAATWENYDQQAQNEFDEIAETVTEYLVP